MQKEHLPQHHKDGTGGSKTMTLANLSNKKVICKTFIPGDKMASHFAPTDVFVLLLDGQMDISLGGTPLGDVAVGNKMLGGTPLGDIPLSGETLRFTAGDYIVIPANTIHALACVETARLLIYR